ncbi:MAG: 2-amino-4-hydroxy-6-hydroxymethyldihydropteridine diphosphokinase [Anaerolineales bacterium]|nr:2-amino-4-hydroxy-6-hydroxymethyldihydropteridine diphosphokinase [Anaerolineales bacterium]
MTEQHRVYIGLGSNIEPARNLQAAIQALSQPGLPGSTRLLAISSVWSSPPLGTHGPQFLNAAATLSTELTADDFKTQVLRPLEAAQGRVRTADRNAPRTLDLDLLMYDDELLDPELWLAAHIALPLSELLPELTHAESGETLAAAAQRLASQQPAQRTDIQLN